MSENLPTEKPSDGPTVLDVQGALKRLGGRKTIYTRTLQSFKLECTGSHTAISRDLAAGDREKASRTVHSVKGVASTIGAVGLSHVAAKLEGVIRREDQGVGGLLDEFRIKLEQTLRAVDEVLKAETGE